MSYFDQENRPTAHEAYVNRRLMDHFNALDWAPCIPVTYLTIQADYVGAVNGESFAVREQIVVCDN